MVRVIRASTESPRMDFTSTPTRDDILKALTPQELVEFLQQIVELRDLEISYEETEDGKMAFCIGDLVYVLTKEEVSRI